MPLRLACSLSDRVAVIGGTAEVYLLDLTESRGVCGICSHGQADKIVLNTFQRVDKSVFPNRLTLIVCPKEDVLLQVRSPGEAQFFQQFPGTLIFGVAFGVDPGNAA